MLLQSAQTRSKMNRSVLSYSILARAIYVPCCGTRAAYGRALPWSGQGGGDARRLRSRAWSDDPADEAAQDVRSVRSARLTFAARSRPEASLGTFSRHRDALGSTSTPTRSSMRRVLLLLALAVRLDPVCTLCAAPLRCRISRPRLSAQHQASASRALNPPAEPPTKKLVDFAVPALALWPSTHAAHLRDRPAGAQHVLVAHTHT